MPTAFRLRDSANKSRLRGSIQVTLRGAIVAILVELIGITDAVSKVGTFVRVFTDPVGITDTFSTLLNHIRTIVESVGITDVISKIGTFVRTFADSVGITDGTSWEKFTMSVIEVRIRLGKRLSRHLRG